MLAINFSPFPVLQTERLLLREINVSDAAQIFKLRSNPVSMQYLSRPVMKNEEEAQLLITRNKGDISSNTGITWAIALKEQPETLIGTFGFWRIEKENYRAEIGYMFLPEYFGKGYAKEVIFCGIDFAFHTLNIHSIEANIHPANKASEAVLLKAGFVQEGYFKENFFFNGSFLDSVIFSLVKK